MLSRSSIQQLSPPFLRNSIRSINLLGCRNLSNMSDRTKPNLVHNRTHESDPRGLDLMETEICGPMLASVQRDTSPQHVFLANEGRLDNRRPSPGRLVSPPKSSGHSVDMPPPPEPFDICPAKRGGPPKLKRPLHLKNKERRNELAKSSEPIILRPGMIILKNYLSRSDQINITTVCRDLGLGTGGFYQPGYNDGAKLHLQMMCLGKNWDPQTREYGDYRSIDGAVAPAIPEDFQMLVKKTIQDSHALIKKKTNVNNPEDILPWMQPDLCIVNFYSETGKLGLHQDRDESKESLDQRLPVVSFSIGDSAKFLYGDTRNVDDAKEVVLESGDVLIFGGESRHVFHGVPSINKGTAPKFLAEETNFRPGRLNLTFRKF